MNLAYWSSYRSNTTPIMSLIWHIFWTESAWGAQNFLKMPKTSLLNMRWADLLSILMVIMPS